MSYFNYSVKAIEETETSWVSLFLTGAFAILVRCFLEAFSQRSGNYLNLPSDSFLIGMLHLGLFYILLTFILIIILHYATGTKIESISKMVYSGLLLLIIAPIIDLLVSGGRGFNMTYFMPDDSNLITNFLTYSASHAGATIGIKIETFIIFTICFFYVRLKGASLLASFATVFLIYSSVFFLAATPIWLKAICSYWYPHYQLSNFLIIRYYSFLLLIAMGWTWWLADRNCVWNVAKDGRYLRVVYYSLLLILGFALGFSVINERMPGSQYNYFAIFSDVMFLIIGLFFASIFTIITNNIHDHEIDRFSNSERPLVNGSIDKNKYLNIGYAALFFSLYYTALCGFKSVFLMMVVIGIYYLYSTPPIRFKRLLVASKVAVSLSSLAFILMGYLSVTDSMMGFPKALFPIVLIGITMCANVIDLKDRDADSAAGIKTLPVVMGLNRAKIMIGISFLLTYVAFSLILKNAYAVTILFFLGAMQLYFVTKHHYEEWKILLLNVASLIYVVVCIA